jgi:type I restriction enzyme S subunit
LTIDANELPRGWVTTNLDAITTAVSTNGKKVKTKDAQPAGEFPVIDQGAAECAGYLDDECLVINASVDHPIVLFGDHTRIVKYIQRDFIPGADGTKLLQAKDGIQPKYLHYLVTAAEVPDRGYGRHFHHLKEMALPLAPAAEQKRIADKLDTVLTRVDAVNTRLARVAPLLKRFRQSVLAAATSGRLTEDWRTAGNSDPATANSLTKVPLPSGYKRLAKQSFKPTKIPYDASDLPANWLTCTIGELYETNILIDFADGNHGSLYPRKEEFDLKGALFLTATQMSDSWEVDVLGCPRLKSEKANQLTKGWATHGDLLLSHNATVGRVGILDSPEEDVLLGTSVTFYRFNTNYFSAQFGRIVFSSLFFQDQLRSVMAQTTRDQVPITKQVSLNLVVPPLKEQSEIVRRVETLFALADRLEARLAQAQNAATRLTPALLAKAFRGELVPQDPNDEPAAELLRRLQAERESAVASKPKRGRKA